MSRTPDDDWRDELLRRSLDYVLKHGVADLSLRPLAKAVGSSPRVLLHYFGSKEQLLAEILRHARSRQREAFAGLRAIGDSSQNVCRAAWEIMSAARSAPLFRLFFEVYALALVDRKRFHGFFKSAIDDWLEFLEVPFLREGRSAKRAREMATVILAGFRGFLLDLTATRDRERIDGAVLLWLEMLNRPAKEEIADADTA